MDTDDGRPLSLARLDNAVPLLAELPLCDRAALAAIARETHAGTGDVLACDGVFQYELIAIEVGEADLSRGGERVTRLSEGDVFGEVGSLERRVGTCTLVARTPMALITLSALDLRRLRRREPATVARMQAALLRGRVPVAG